MADKNQQQKIELVSESFGCAREFDHFIADEAERAFESLIPNLLPERPVIHEELLSQIKDSDFLQSLLYDLDLMPAQLDFQKDVTIGLVMAYSRLEGILLRHKAGNMLEKGKV